ncbi:MAG: hypothetical protein VCF25_22835 [Candidatus Poribacteria bacterium]
MLNSIGYCWEPSEKIADIADDGVKIRHYKQRQERWEEQSKNYNICQ